MTGTSELKMNSEGQDAADFAARLAPWLTEARATIALAAPLAFTQLLQIAVITTDVIIVGALGKEPLAAIAIGSTVFFFAWLVGYGPVGAVAPMIAQILGARPNDRVGARACLRMGLWATGLISPFLMLLLLYGESLLLALGQKPALAALAGPYIHAMAFAVPFSIAYGVLRSFVTALSRPRAALYVMIATVIVNGIGVYALVHGVWGAPKLGLFGAGIASAFGYAFSFVAMLMVILLASEFRPYRVLRRFWRPHWEKLWEVFRLGVPIGLTMIFEAMMFNSATLMMGTFGAAALAAHQIAINVPSITFMVPLGIALAGTVRVGLFAGARDFMGVRRAGLTTIVLGCAFMLACGVVMAIFPREIAGLYIDARDPDNADVLDYAEIFLRVAAAFQFFDALQVAAAFVLRGLKDTRVPMFIAAGSYWAIGMPVCLLLGFGLGMNGLGIWIGLAAGLFAASVAMTLRFLYKTGMWR